MKQLVILFFAFTFLVPALAADKKQHQMVPVYNRLTRKTSSYPLVRIHDAMFVTPDSLNTAYTKQNAYPTVGGAYLGDTIVIVGLVVIPSAGDPPHHGIIYTANGWTMMLHDTGTTANEWNGMFIRVSDTANARLDGFNNPQVGDIIRMTVVMNVFPTSGQTLCIAKEPAPIPGDAINIISENNSIPKPTVVTVGQFYQGQYQGGKINYPQGEQYNTSFVEFHHLLVTGEVNATRGTFQVTDSAGNYLSDYDVSFFFTLGNTGGSGDSLYRPPPVGAVIDTIRGSIFPSSGQENPRGYRICPLNPGDVVYGVSLPSVTSHSRTPVIPTGSDLVTVEAKVEKITGGFPIGSATLYASINGAAFTGFPMTLATADSFYTATIEDQDNNPYPAGTNVRYFIKALDTAGNATILANASRQNSLDSTKGLFFYNVQTNTNLTIHEAQYTPYTNGLSAYIGGKTTLTGVVTASDSEINENASLLLAGAGTTSWYIQNGTGPWNGIWVVKDTSIQPPLDSLKLGDSVTVVGKIEEPSEGGSGTVTQLRDSAFTVISHNRPLPAPVVVTTGTFGNRGDGDPVAEPYEGVLIRIINATVTSVSPYFSDPSEYQIDDGSGPMRVRQDGINSYSNQIADTSQGKTILHVGDKIDTLTGIGWFSYGAYKIVPRRNSDFSVGDPYNYNAGWNLVSVPRIQTPASTGYSVTSIYPGSLTNAFAYVGGYSPQSTLANGVGYWIKFSTARTILQVGLPMTVDTIALVRGWNMVGSLGSSIATTSVTASPSGNHLGQFFYYSHGYHPSTTLDPSFGYWVKSDSVGTMIENSGGASTPKALALEKGNSITIKDVSGNSQTLYFDEDNHNAINLADYEMPPVFANAGFDVRFASGRILETYTGGMKTAKAFGINAAQFTGPVTVSWNIVDRMTKFSLDAMQKGKPSKSIDLKGAGSQVLSIAQGSGALSLNVGGRNVPQTFYLAQNYPNPFNPSTTIEVGLHTAAHLQVAVYNVLGQKVATLVDENRDAGIYSIIWNGNAETGVAASSGVYFVRMSASGGAGSFTATKKIMMMK